LYKGPPITEGLITGLTMLVVGSPNGSSDLALSTNLQQNTELQKNLFFIWSRRKIVMPVQI
jgi:hypothetical protein